MRTHAPAAGRSWQATLIIALFFVAVAGAALGGWWYARESPAHQGPIVLISVDGLRPDRLAAYGATTAATPAMDALAADGVVFERAYTHSPLLLPAHASMLAGQLPFEHGVRDDAGFVLGTDTRSLAELLRSRGFETGAAVSSFLLRRESGVAQGFQFFDAELPGAEPDQAPVVVRDGELTAGAAERWVGMQEDQRFFLFLQVDEASAEAVVTRLVQQLKDRDLYDQATIVLTADRGETGVGLSLNDAALRVPLIVKQPDSEGAGRRIASPVQHIDLLPTMLDLVRAPIPSGLTGRSLREVLDDDEAQLAERPIYSESLAARFRLGDHPVFAITMRALRLIRGAGELLVELDAAPEDPPPGEADLTGMRARLDAALAGRDIGMPLEIAAADEEHYAALGYLSGGTVTGTMTDSELQARPSADLEALVQSHRAAAMLAGQKRYAAAIDRLRAITGTHPDLTIVHYQTGMLLARSGRVDDAVTAFRVASAQQPDNPYVTIALARALARTPQLDAAMEQALKAVALAERRDVRTRAAAHEAATRIALVRMDAEAATAHAAAANDADPALPMRQFVRGTLLYDEAKYEEALATFQEADTILRDNSRVLEQLQLALGDTLAQLDRHQEAEMHFREELVAFPRTLRAYSSLATLYRATNRPEEIEAVIAGLLAAAPTAEGYATAARLWTIVGERARADAVRADARTRFPGDRTVAPIVRGGRR